MKDIYSIIRRAQRSIDILESVNAIRGIEFQASELFKDCGIRANELVNIFFAGSFSGGKTTFLNRLYGEKVGAISPFPETGCIVRHGISAEKVFSINFNYEYASSNEEDANKFDCFLKRFDLGKHFKLNAGNWQWKRNNDDVISKTDWNADDILGFLKEVNEFPGSIKEIRWNHRKTDSNYHLDLARFYDLPGYGGGRAEDVAALQRAFTDYKPNIIVCVLDTDKGDLTDDLEEFLEQLTYHFANNKNILFAWMFQKPFNGNEQELNDWKDGRRNQLRGSLEHLNEKYSLSMDSEILGRIINAPIKYAIGGRDENASATKAISELICTHYVGTLDSYLKGYRESLAQLDYLVKGTPLISFNRVIDPAEALVSKLHELTMGSSIPTIEDINSVLNELLAVEKTGVNEELDIAIQQCNLETKRVIDEISIYSENRDLKAKFMDVLGEVKNNLKSVSAVVDEKKENRVLNINMIKRDKLQETLKSRDGWLKNIFTAQALQLLIAYHKNDLAGYYTSNIEDQIILNIGNDLVELKEKIKQE